jgi:hypothetical protein
VRRTRQFRPEEPFSQGRRHKLGAGALKLQLL